MKIAFGICITLFILTVGFIICPFLNTPVYYYSGTAVDLPSETLKEVLYFQKVYEKKDLGKIVLRSSSKKFNYLFRTIQVLPRELEQSLKDSSTSYTFRVIMEKPYVVQSIELALVLLLALAIVFLGVIIWMEE